MIAVLGIALGIALGLGGVALAGPAIPAVGRRFGVEPVAAQTV
jgi:hypothetical protein